MKERLDVLLVRLGYFESREKAKAAIMAGLIYVDNRLSDKAGTPTKETSDIQVKHNPCPYVGRGGLKLKKAIDEFRLNLYGLTAMDMGASTGGFTDCMLQEGVSKVYAVDVGYGQLHYRLRNDQRVVNMERVNIRYLDPSEIEDKMDFISIDVSFISLKLILPVAAELLKKDGIIICLVKPQFEAGREEVGRHGLVKDKASHLKVIQDVIGYGKSNNLSANGLTWSPITGAKGNIEYLLMFEKKARQNQLNLKSTIDAAYSALY